MSLSTLKAFDTPAPSFVVNKPFPKDFLSIADLTTEQIEVLFALAAETKSKPAKYVGALASKQVALLF